MRIPYSIEIVKLRDSRLAQLAAEDRKTSEDPHPLGDDEYSFSARQSEMPHSSVTSAPSTIISHSNLGGTGSPNLSVISTEAQQQDSIPPTIAPPSLWSSTFDFIADARQAVLEYRQRQDRRDSFVEGR
jgi:hypothetical protein